ncbi:nucleotidyltransferase family protein [Desulfobulbus sp. US4]|nr:nucleotidyltransferase family protein [Desulfobulbus sp. US4]
MKRQHAIKLLTQCKQELQKRFGVSKLLLFGSTVRDTATDASDVDILVAFAGPTNSKRYFGLLFYLEDLLECTVDLVTEKALRPELRPFVEKEGLTV